MARRAAAGRGPGSQANQRAGESRKAGEGRKAGESQRSEEGQRARRAAEGQRARRAGRRQGERGSGRHADPARHVAFEVLRASRERDAYANLLLPALLRERGLTGRDAALATELSYGTLRGQATYDAVIAACSTRGLDQIDPPVRDVLRLGAHQLLATRVGAHAAVATSVDLAREVAGPGAAGFVNAVLRRVSTHDLEAWIAAIAPDRAADPVGHLAVRYSHPRWIVAAYSESLGEDGVAGPGDAALAETEAALAASAGRPLVTLCAVPGLADQAELTADGAETARWSAFGAYLQGGDPAAVAAVRQGRAAVQDEASQLATLALTRVDVGTPDRLWLDLCAGPGGKARLLAGLAARSGARLVAADIRPHRARLVSAAVTGAAGVVVADGTAPAWRPGSFDRVIADVPCSGLGALRRRPEARWRKSPADVAGLGALQRRLLASALAAARPGGAVAYVTCSPHVGETRAVVADVLAGRDDVAVLDAPAVLAEVPDLRCPGPGGRYAQFWPHRHGTDAIFLALLQRRPGRGDGG
ncbi:MAG TPA: transcription antitermination factor NusB [Streptosporangiaceae bacterium]|nr:transcription antitermination factor NusB [Streptosporangiaceae bacterium]